MHDDASAAKLDAALQTAVRELSQLGADPIVIAASPNRFNDIFWSDWRAVRFGEFVTERHDYGRPRDFEKDLQAGPPGAREARRILDQLEAASWRDLFTDAFGLSWTDQVLALVLEDELPWLVFSGSNSDDENHVFALWGERRLSYFGECVERFDWDMQQSRALKFQLHLDG